MSQLATVQTDIIAAIEANPKLQPTTKAQYKKALTNYLVTGQSLADASALSAYAATLPKSSQSFLKAVVRLWGDDLARRAKAGATPENIAAVQATVFRVEALNDAIEIPASKGQKAHTWLTQNEVKRLLDSYNVLTIQSQRDRLILGLLVGAGLRREELAALRFEDVIIQPIAGKFRTVLNVRGKGAKDRIVPINDRLAAALDQWGAIVGTTGAIARSIGKGGGALAIV